MLVCIYHKNCPFDIYIPTLGNPTMAVCSFMDKVVEEYIRRFPVKLEEAVKDEVREKAMTTLRRRATDDTTSIMTNR